MTALALALAEWAHNLRPDPADLELADRSLRDTVAVALAAPGHPVTRLAAGLPDGARWAVAAHVLDFDDLHMESTTHISALCVPTALATGGGARGYLAAAGVMARLGTALGWPHYSAGWHATCTAGAPACAAGAAVALGLGPERIATAIALAIPGAGGVQRAFGTDAKSLQAGFAVDAGIRAARARRRGRAGRLVGAGRVAVPGRRGPGRGRPGRPGRARRAGHQDLPLLLRAAAADQRAGRPGRRGLDPGSVRRIVLRTPEATVAPLIHHRPVTGLQGKFSLEYAAAAALLDRHPGFASFTDDAVRRPAARRLTSLVETELYAGRLLAARRRTGGRGAHRRRGAAASSSSSRRERRGGRPPTGSCTPS